MPEASGGWVPTGQVVQLGKMILTQCHRAQAWNTYNTPKLDFQLFFCSNNLRAMAQLQTLEEAKQMPLTWDIKQASNITYFATHLKYMTTYFFGSKKTA